jgi:hypothetical protein
MKGKSIIYFFAGLIVPLIIASCTKVIDLKLGNDAGRLVIEGNIINVRGPQYIKLSRNVPFSSTNTYPAVSGAAVKVSDDHGNVFLFAETVPGTYVNYRLPGVPGRTYTMNVTTGGTTYTAVSSMPKEVLLDSLTDEKNAFGDKKLREVTLHYGDPLNVANQYKFLLYVNNKEVPVIFAYDDEFTDGRYVNFNLFQNKVDIHAGDTTTVEMQCIDKSVYTYWFTLMQQQLGGPGGGGVAPANPPTNITPVTLGYFSAHTVNSLTVILK